MSDYIYEGLSVVAREVKDFSLEEGPDGNKRQVELPGKVQVGVVIEGVFKPLAAFGSAGLKADIERAKESDSTPGASAPGPQQTGTGVDTPPAPTQDQPQPQQ